MAVEQSRLRAEKAADEREVRAARDRAELLLREVNHRIANSLALVASLVSLQANALDNPVAKEALAETRARIYAVSLVHKRLYSADDVGSVDMAEYLGGLLEHLENSMRGEGMGASVAASIAPLRVLTDTAVSLGVIATELVTNAFKYAYPTGMPGLVRVDLRMLDAERAELTVADDGPGWSGHGPVQGTGLGSRIVRAMCASLGAEFGYEADRGTVARLRFPLRR